MEEGASAAGRAPGRAGRRPATTAALLALAALCVAVAAGMAAVVVLVARDVRGAAEAQGTVVGPVACQLSGESLACRADVRAGDAVRTVPVPEAAEVGTVLTVLVDPATGDIRNSGSRASTVGWAVVGGVVGLVALAGAVVLVRLAVRRA